MALITGASRGIGAAVALRFAAEGAHVVLAARTVGGLEEVDDAIRAAGGSATLVPVDLRDFVKIDELAAKLFDRWGRLDILVGNAAEFGVFSPLGHIDPATWAEVIDLNLTANWRLIRAMDPLLRAAPAGRAIFVTAGVARGVFPYWGPYAVSKAGLEMLVRIYAGEISKTQVRANLIDPGIVRTRLRARAFPGEDPGRLPPPQSVTDAFVALALPECTRNGEIVMASALPHEERSILKPAEVARYWEANAETWTRHARAGYDIYRDGLNTPAFLDMLPPVRSLCGLDIGCGEGSNTRKLALLGARMHAIDVAPTFIRHARDAERAEPLGVGYLMADATDLPFVPGSFDFATAFMSIMDMVDQGRALCEATRVLRPGGFLQFSILHPCFVPPHRRVLREPDGTTRAIEIAGYFDATDGRIDTFWFERAPQEERDRTEPFRVPRFHRTLSEWVDLIVEAGLVIERFGEPCVSVELAKAEPALEDTRVAPLFLHIHAIKPRR